MSLDPASFTNAKPEYMDIGPDNRPNLEVRRRLSHDEIKANLEKYNFAKISALSKQDYRNDDFVVLTTLFGQIMEPLKEDYDKYKEAAMRKEMVDKTLIDLDRDWPTREQQYPDYWSDERVFECEYRKAVLNCIKRLKDEKEKAEAARAEAAGGFRLAMT